MSKSKDSRTSIEKRGDEQFAQRERDQKPLRESIEKSVGSPSKLYELGINWVNDPERETGFYLKYDPGVGTFMGHKILIRSDPEPVKGLNYGAVPNFQPLRNIENGDELRRFAEVFLSGEPFCKDLYNFFCPLWDPSVRNTEEDRLGLYLETLRSIDKANEYKNWSKPISLKHSFDPYCYIDPSKPKSLNPITFIPPRQVFPPSLRNELKFEDIFTLFEPNECALFKMFLGRVGVGPNLHIPDGWNEPLTHTSRQTVIVLGREAGLGKSTQLKMLRSALAKVNMSMATFRKTSERFGLADALSSNIAFRDDTDIKSLKSFISCEETKCITSGEDMLTEEKYQKAIATRPICALLVNANKIDPNSIYELDPGIIDRVKVLNTRNSSQLKKLLKELPKNSPSYGSPSLEPARHIPYLAEQYNVSTDAIMLWAMRLATDEFHQLIKSGDVIKHREKVHYHTNRLSVRFKPHIEAAFMRSLLISLQLCHQDENLLIPELTPQALIVALKCYKKVGGGLLKSAVSQKLKEEWEKNNRTSLHFWTGFREIQLTSVANAIEKHEKTTSANAFDLSSNIPEIMKQVLSHVCTREGIKLGGGYSYSVDSWEDARIDRETMQNIANTIKSNLTPAQLTYLHDPNTEVSLEWTENFRYSPSTAEQLRPDWVEPVSSPSTTPFN